MMTILIAAATLLLVIVVPWLITAFWLSSTRGLSLHQTFLHVPLKALWRIEDHSALHAVSKPPVVYAILHQSQLDPVLMLSLLPPDTLHILDERSARSPWLEPWREMARTIAFNAGHVFVSRRLVRQLKGRGRMAVYFADGLENDPKGFRLYRAVARIAASADARIVPISVQGSRNTLFAPPSPGIRRGLLPKLRIVKGKTKTVTVDI